SPDHPLRSSVNFDGAIPIAPILLKETEAFPGAILSGHKALSPADINPPVSRRFMWRIHRNLTIRKLVAQETLEFFNRLFHITRKEYRITTSVVKSPRLSPPSSACDDYSSSSALRPSRPALSRRTSSFRVTILRAPFSPRIVWCFLLRYQRHGPSAFRRLSSLGGYIRPSLSQSSGL